MKTAELTAVENKPAYLRSIIKEITGRLTITTAIEPTKGVAFPIVEQVKSWGEQRRSGLHAQFISLLKEERKSYIDAALADLVKRGIASTTMIRKVEEGDWKNPLLMSRAVELYAVSLHGAEWMVEKEPS